MAENDSRLARRNVKSLLEAGLMSQDHQISVLETDTGHISKRSGLPYHV